SNVICALSFGHQFSAEDEEFQKLVQALKIIFKFFGDSFHANVQKEIEDVFGSSGSISYQDQKKLPYTNAVIHEMQRLKYALLYGIPRQSTKDVTMRGYHIPKVKNMFRMHCSSPTWKEEENRALGRTLFRKWQLGTFIIPDLRSVLLDPEQWETPEKFNPNHFLDEDGKFIDREEFLPFGLGKRVCMGQQLARIEIFIFLTSLLRAFNFWLPEGVKELNEAPVAKMTMHPHPYK
ncbi:Cytochrome protein, partial [Ophiophagus hannah]